MTLHEGDLLAPATTATNHWTEVQALGVTFTGPHGVGAHERAEGRRFSVDAIIRLRACHACDSDDLSQTLSYAHVAQVISHIGTTHSYHLVERLAEVIAQALLSLPLVAHVMLDVRKHAPGLPGAPPWVGVRLLRANPPKPVSPENTRPSAEDT